MTAIIMIMSLAIAFLILMIYAEQCYTAELADKIELLNQKIDNSKNDIMELRCKTDRIIRRIKEMEHDSTAAGRN